MDIINIRKLYTEVIIMPKYIKADFFYPHGVRRGGYLETCWWSDL